jgi:hypothetical protein
MVVLPLIDTIKHTITNTFILNKDMRVLRGYCITNQNAIERKKYFREEDYYKYGVSVVYENVDESRLAFYDNIFNNIKIFRVNSIPNYVLDKRLIIDRYSEYRGITVKEGFVPTADVAVAIADIVLSNIYGEAQIRKEKPFSIILDNDIWIIEGHLEKKHGWRNSMH